MEHHVRERSFQPLPSPAALPETQRKMQKSKSGLSSRLSGLVPKLTHNFSGLFRHQSGGSALAEASAWATTSDAPAAEQIHISGKSARSSGRSNSMRPKVLASMASAPQGTIVRALHQMDSHGARSDGASPPVTSPPLAETHSRRVQSEYALRPEPSIAVVTDVYEPLTDSEAGSPTGRQQEAADIKLPAHVAEFAAQLDTPQQSGLIYISGKSARSARRS